MQHVSIDARPLRLSMSEAGTALFGVSSAAYGAMKQICERCLENGGRARLLNLRYARDTDDAVRAAFAVLSAEGVAWDSVEALRNQMYQCEHKREHKRREEQAKLWAGRFLDGQSIVSIAAAERCFSPSTLGRILVKHFCDIKGEARKPLPGNANFNGTGHNIGATAQSGEVHGDTGQTAATRELASVCDARQQQWQHRKEELLRKKAGSQQREKALVRHLLNGDLELPEHLQNCTVPPTDVRGVAAAQHAKAALRCRFASELKAACAADRECGPGPDRVRHTIGLEYEFVLEQKLHNLGIPFKTEAELKGSKDMHKTPDALLQLPFAVRVPVPVCHGNSAENTGNGHSSSGQAAPSRWHVVNWIDSKAQFGSPDIHENNRKQMDGYVNRFGTGLVIYWNSFVAELNNIDQRNDVLHLGGFPTELHFL